MITEENKSEPVKTRKPRASGKAKKSADEKNEAPEEKISFENAITELEETVKILEDGKTSLDRSMELYQRGVELIRECKKQLDTARQTVINLGPSGELNGHYGDNT